MSGGFYSKYRDPKEKKFQRRYLSKANMGFFINILGKYKKELLLAAIFTLLYTLSILIPPYLTQRIIDDYIMAGNPAGMINLMVAFFSLYAASWYFAYQQRIWSQSAGQKAVFSIREALHQKLILLPLSFHEKQKKGSLSSLLMNDVSSLSSAITEGIVGLMSDVLTLAGITLIMYRMQPQLTLLLLATIPIILLAMFLLGRRIREAFTNVREKMADLNAHVEENLSGIRVIQSLGIQKKSETEFRQVSEGNFQAKLRAMFFLALLFPVMSLTSGLGNAILLWYGGLQVQTGAITLGVFVAFLAYIRKFYMPLRNLSDLYNTYLSALASLNRIVEVMSVKNPLHAPESNRYPRNLTPLDIFSQRILFDGLYFSYESEWVLKNLNLEIEKGERIGIVGETGSGKSSLIRLLTRLYDPTRGQILLDNHRLSDIPFSILRDLIAVVPQNTFLYSDTIANNIRQGNPMADFSEVQEAAKKVKAHDMIMSLPGQYNTILGEGGIGLSGGQRQLIAFSRALLKDPEILILDEATSSMDIVLEDRLEKSMDEILKGRTTLVISHRLRTLENLDRICILDKGFINACGTHRELLHNHSYYQRLVKAGEYQKA